MGERIRSSKGPLSSRGEDDHMGFFESQVALSSLVIFSSVTVYEC